MGDLANELRDEIQRRFPIEAPAVYGELLDRVEEIEEELGTEATAGILLGVAASLQAVNAERRSPR